MTHIYEQEEMEVILYNNNKKCDFKLNGKS